MEDGLNIATRANEGDAYVYHWENLHNQINNIIQRDIQNRQNLKNEYEKSALMAAQAMKGLRPADVGLYKDKYNIFKQAAMMLANPKIQHNTKELQYWTDKKMDAYADMLQTQEGSKNYANQLHELSLQHYKDGGANSTENYSKLMSEANQLDYRTGTEQGRTNPDLYFYTKPKIKLQDIDKYIFGGKDVMKPFKYEQGDRKYQTAIATPKNVTIQTDPTTGSPKISQITGKPILNYSGLIGKVSDVFSMTQGSGIAADLRKVYEDDFRQDPQIIKQTFDKANALLKESGEHTIGTYTPEYYFLAKKIVDSNNQIEYSTSDLGLNDAAKRKQRMTDFKERLSAALPYSIQKIKAYNSAKTEGQSQAIADYFDDLVSTSANNPEIKVGDKNMRSLSYEALAKNYTYTEKVPQSDGTFKTKQVVPRLAIDENANIYAIKPKLYTKNVTKDNSPDGRPHAAGEEIPNEFEVHSQVPLNTIATQIGKEIPTESRGISLKKAMDKLKPKKEEPQKTPKEAKNAWNKAISGKPEKRYGMSPDNITDDEWEVDRDLKDKPTHEEGGVDLKVNGDEVNAEKDELVLVNKSGEKAIVPKKDRWKILSFLRNKKNKDITEYVSDLPKNSSVAKDGGNYAGGDDELVIYKSNEKTKTGKRNSFEHNDFGLKEKDLYDLAKQYGFRTDTNANFQTDLEKHMVENYPDVYNKIMGEYGATNAGKFADGLLGARTMSVAKYLIETPKKQPKKEVPKSNTPDTSVPPEDKINTDYVIDVRGDDQNGKGAYYFAKDRETFDKIVSSIPSYSNTNTSEKGGYATYDMNDDVFREYHAKNNINLLGSAYARKDKKFVKKN